MFLALVRGSNEPQIHERLRDTHEHVFIAPLRRRLSGPDADVRARMAAALAGGLLYALWVAGDEGLLRTDRTELVSRYGALFQGVLTPGAGEPVPRPRPATSSRSPSPAKRARTVPACAEGPGDTAVTARLDTDRATAARWRDGVGGVRQFRASPSAPCRRSRHRRPGHRRCRR
ncbi:hypothetical protein SGRIM128S_05063 [Streptomyces griseomycini]